MSLLALSTSFEYVCHGSKGIINVSLFQSIDVRISKIDPRAERVN